MTPEMEQQLQELLDKKACEEVILRYCRTLDWLDTAGQETCYWPDADIDYGIYNGKTEAWVPLVMQIEQDSLHRWHACSGVMVSVEGQHASAECYGLASASNRTEDGELSCHLIGGRYLDELEKRHGEWRIIKRRYVADWSHEFNNGLEELVSGGFAVNVLNIMQGDHPDYRRL